MPPTLGPAPLHRDGHRGVAACLRLDPPAVRREGLHDASARTASQRCHTRAVIRAARDVVTSARTHDPKSSAGCSTRLELDPAPRDELLGRPATSPSGRACARARDDMQPRLARAHELRRLVDSPPSISPSPSAPLPHAPNPSTLRRSGTHRARVPALVGPIVRSRPRTELTPAQSRSAAGRAPQRRACDRHSRTCRLTARVRTTH